MEKIFHIEDVANIQYQSIGCSPLSNYELIEGLRCWDNKTVDYIYYNYFPRINEYIHKNKGSSEDTSDVFHTALLVLNKKLNRELLELEKDFYYYFFGVCRRIWLNKLKEKRREVSYDDYCNLEGREGLEDTTLLVFATDDAEKMELLKHHIKKLDEDSQRIIELRLDNVPYKKIVEIMGFKSEQQARDKKHYSVDLLTKSIKNDRRFKELIEK